MDIPKDRKYTHEHEWLKLEGDLARAGVTEYAQAQLGDLVYVELPAVGRKVTAGKACGVVESVKAASDLFSPISGTVQAVNERLVDQPELANSDPYGEGWMLVIAPSDPAEIAALLDAAGYEKLLAAAEGA